MRKGMYLILASQLIIWLCLMSSASPAFASSEQATTSRTDPAQMTLLPGWYQPWGYSAFGGEDKNQYTRSVENHKDNKDYFGHDQGNSGNSGLNRGSNEDNSGNVANQIMSQGGIRPGSNNQHYDLFSNDSGNVRYIGYQQGNSGNSGENVGTNRDNSGNSGNQIIN